jgi:hypothetical protein
VDRIVRLDVIALMAAIAICRSADIDSAGVTRNAGRRGMSSNQRECSLGAVVEGRRRPSGSIVAGVARLAHSRIMLGIVRLVVICLMTGITSRRRTAIPLAVTRRTGQANMRSGQGEGSLAMIKGGLIPGSCVVAVFALM